MAKGLQIGVYIKKEKRGKSKAKKKPNKHESKKPYVGQGR